MRPTTTLPPAHHPRWAQPATHLEPPLASSTTGLVKGPGPPPQQQPVRDQPEPPPDNRPSAPTTTTNYTNHPAGLAGPWVDLTLTQAPPPVAACPCIAHSEGVTPTLTPHQQQVNHQATCHDIDFEYIKDWCEIDYPTEYNVTPVDLADHRRSFWPDMNPKAPPQIRAIYQAVKNTGVPNWMGARAPLQSNINIEEWRSLSSGDREDTQLLDFIQFGFPLAYNGPVMHTVEPINHSSALKFPTHIEAFIKDELREGALIGPLTSPMFQQWQHISPMMTRPKSDPEKRCIITDLSFTKNQSVNIKKNCVGGEDRTHSLPTVQHAVDIIKALGPGVTLLTIDINRAYKNFRACPLDWPLLNVTWQREDGPQLTFLDTAMPFGSRLSSLHSSFIVRALEKKGIRACMYLDDLLVIAPDPITAYIQFDIVRDMFRKLGLPEAVKKTQPPSHKVTFLGVTIDTRDMTLSIPKLKVDQTLREVNKTLKRQTISKRQFQSILGHLLHVAKCVPPARLFVARLLDSFRVPNATVYTINDTMSGSLST